MEKWKAFEKRVKQESGIQQISCVKVPEHVIMTKHGRTIRKKTEFDYCAGIDGIAAFFDCKSSGKNKLNFKTYILGEEKIHQFNALCQVNECLNIAGYLIYFYEMETISWVNIKTVRALLEAGENGISPESKGVVSQLDSVPVNLRSLLWGDRSEIIRRLCP